jgi:hypothetical protein
VRIDGRGRGEELWEILDEEEGRGWGVVLKSGAGAAGGSARLGKFWIFRPRVVFSGGGEVSLARWIRGQWTAKIQFSVRHADRWEGSVAWGFLPSDWLAAAVCSQLWRVGTVDLSWVLISGVVVNGPQWPGIQTLHFSVASFYRPEN